jgi:uncharacterized protein YjbI with pentapeptide repeats
MAGPGTSNTDATPYPVWGFAPPSPEPDTKKLDALLASLNGSAERFQTLWFSFLGLTLYLAIAALATTHRNLLLGEQQTLPILNIKVELLPFYVIAPLLYLVFHFYLLMMLALLARTAAEFDKQLRTTLPDPERERYRAQVGNALFLQLLVGMRGERVGVNAVLMGLIALITIVLAPLATLVLMQMMFLPYHHLRITWWHRAVVVADLVLIIVMTYRCFFPRGVWKAPLILGALPRKPRWAMAMTCWVLLVVCLSPATDWLSFRQGRWAGEPKPSSLKEWDEWMEGEVPASPGAVTDYSATANGVVFGLFPDRLKLATETIVGEKTLEETTKEINSRGGDFVPTIKLDDRDLQAADLRSADLRGVSLNNVAMQGAELSGARLDNAELFYARLQRADLIGARLPGTNLFMAQLEGAPLNGAQLQGANLVGAQLQGADLRGAGLQSADLRAAELQGADLVGTKLEGASLNGARLQGADLSYAQLQGTNLGHAQLQGTNLTDANVADSILDETFVFRTDIADADLTTAAIRSVHADRLEDSERFGSPPEPLTPADIEAWIAAATQFASGENKATIVKRFARLKPDFHEESDRPGWSGLVEASLALDPDGAHYRQRLAEFLADLACEPASAPYVARGLIKLGALESLGDQFESLRARIKAAREKPDTCKGVVGFTEDDWRRLEALRPLQDKKVAAPITMWIAPALARKLAP